MCRQIQPLLQTKNRKANSLTLQGQDLAPLILLPHHMRPQDMHVARAFRHARLDSCRRRADVMQHALEGDHGGEGAPCFRQHLLSLYRKAKSIEKNNDYGLTLSNVIWAHAIGIMGCKSGANGKLDEEQSWESGMSSL